jgi:hypothetical protein
VCSFASQGQVPGPARAGASLCRCADEGTWVELTERLLIGEECSTSFRCRGTAQRRPTIRRLLRRQTREQFDLLETAACDLLCARRRWTSTLVPSQTAGCIIDGRRGWLAITVCPFILLPHPANGSASVP